MRYCSQVCSSHPAPSSLNAIKLIRKCLRLASVQYNIKLPILMAKIWFTFVIGFMFACVCVCAIMWVLLTHVEQVCVLLLWFFYVFSPSCSVAWQPPLCFGASPPLMEVAQYGPHFLHLLLFLSESFSFLFLLQPLTARSHLHSSHSSNDLTFYAAGGLDLSY